MNLYATRLLGAESADWRCAGCDPDGMDMQAGNETLRLDFPERVRHALIIAHEPRRLQQLAARTRRHGLGHSCSPLTRYFGWVFSTVVTASDALALSGMLRRFKNTTILVPLVSVVVYRSAFSAKSRHGKKTR
jgi:hypothetical protein